MTDPQMINIYFIFFIDTLLLMPDVIFAFDASACQFRYADCRYARAMLRASYFFILMLAMPYALRAATPLRADTP